MNNAIVKQASLKKSFSDDDYSHIIRCLRGLVLKPEDYVRDPEKVLNEVVGMIPQEYLNMDAVRFYLQFTFQKQVEEAVQWDLFPCPLLFGDEISLVYEGKRYKAAVRSRNKELEVILKDRDSPSRKVVTIPNGVDVSFTDTYDGACSDYGLQMAKEVLLELVLEKRYLSKA